MVFRLKPGGWSGGVRAQIGGLLGRLNRGDAAIGMAAEANDLHSVADALAVVATKLLLFRGEAGTGQIRALFGIRHNPPLPVRSTHL